MPNSTKQTKKDDFIKEDKEKAKKKETSTASTSVKSTVKVSEKETKKATTQKKSTTSKEKATKSKSSEKAKATKSSAKKTKVNPVKSLLARSRAAKKSKSVQPPTVMEYYDLPYRYNETVVRILAQTPSILFVYWDISDSDRKKFTEKYGNKFFNQTKPVLLIHNKTKNYSFEVEINDFANSWYLRMQEPDCEYEIELGRRNVEDSSKYIYISSSNRMSSPNDHVLFEQSDFRNVRFRNVKTGHISTKDFGSLRLITNIGEIYNQKHKVYSFYHKLYKDEVLESHTMFSNPSSGNPTSGQF